jgi:uncharacterized DUF497 family protein
MWLRETVWIDKFISKIQKKHNVIVEEVEEALLSGALFYHARRGRIKGENVYVAYGKTQAGRYLFIVLIYKPPMRGLIISARDMTIKEKRFYNAKKG